MQSEIWTADHEQQRRCPKEHRHNHRYRHMYTRRERPSSVLVSTTVHHAYQRRIENAPKQEQGHREYRSSPHRRYQMKFRWNAIRRNRPCFGEVNARIYDDVPLPRRWGVSVMLGGSDLGERRTNQDESGSATDEHDRNTQNCVTHE